MKRAVLAWLMILVSMVLIDRTDAHAQKSKTKGERVMWTADEMKWDTLKSAPPGSGVMDCVLWGNLDKGPFGVLIKFPPGFTTPLHYHSSTLKAVVLKGAYIYVPEKGEEKRLGAGSYFTYPAGDRHSTHSAEDSETIFFVEGSGKFDVVPIEAKK
jgi:quercetin dioxygenase-like cupin family protein